MRKKGLAGTIAIAILAIALAVILVVSYFVLKNFVVLDWQLFPKEQEVLDLRTQAITPEEYDTLAWKMPGTRILWSVPFQGTYYDSEITSLTLTHLAETDVDVIAYFSSLQTVNAENCTDYGPLMALYLAYPDLQVNYTVPIGGGAYPPDTETVTPETLTQQDIQLLQYLPRLKLVDGTGCRDFVSLRELERDYPQWQVRYLTSIAGTEISPNTRSLEITGGEYQELSVGLAAMEELKELTIHDPQATGEELILLRQEYPDVQIHWDVTIFGNTYPDDTTELDISSQSIGSIDRAREIASKFPSLEKLIVDSSGITDDDMAAYREEMRSSYKVVWTIIFTDTCSARTDDTVFFPQAQIACLHDEEAVKLRYCEEMICVDMGHHPIKSVEFVRYMPHLKYLILAWTCVEDITPLETCKELIFLELDHDVVHDYTPLLGCTALEDLNINDHQWTVSIEPIKQMTWLKNLWACSRNYTEKLELTEALTETNVVTVNPPTTFISSTQRCPDGLGWRNLENYYDMRDMLNEGSNGWLDGLNKRYME